MWLFIRDVWMFSRSRKRFYLFPVLLLFAMLGTLLLLTPTAASIPIIYTMF
jgi:hypothetical protein